MSVKSGLLATSSPRHSPCSSRSAATTSPEEAGGGSSRSSRSSSRHPRARTSRRCSKPLSRSEKGPSWSSELLRVKEAAPKSVSSVRPSVVHSRLWAYRSPCIRPLTACRWTQAEATCSRMVSSSRSEKVLCGGKASLVTLWKVGGRPSRAKRSSGMSGSTRPSGQPAPSPAPTRPSGPTKHGCSLPTAAVASISFRGRPSEVVPPLNNFTATSWPSDPVHLALYTTPLAPSPSWSSSCSSLAGISGTADNQPPPCNRLIGLPAKASQESLGRLSSQSGSFSSLLAAIRSNSKSRQFIISSGKWVNLFPANIHFRRCLSRPIERGIADSSLSVSMSHAIEGLSADSSINLKKLFLNDSIYKLGSFPS
mmetsp:Transcript_14881/g.20388  ORF Transcript_14881/g.20388 Transcript_14881/m.20388 type:complete len:367 (-) Transcript_14881:239-1339(-)